MEGRGQIKDGGRIARAIVVVAQRDAIVSEVGDDPAPYVIRDQE
jgi:hypothetical protein